jgi:hypothetical protein
MDGLDESRAPPGVGGVIGILFVLGALTVRLEPGHVHIRARKSLDVRQRKAGVDGRRTLTGCTPLMRAAQSLRTKPWKSSSSLRTPLISLLFWQDWVWLILLYEHLEGMRECQNGRTMR